LITLSLFVGSVAGWPLPTDAVLKRLGEPWVAITRSLERWQGVLLWPFRPIGDTLVLRQRFSLFSGASRERYRIRIEVRETASGRWVLRYRPHDPKHQEEASVLEYRRVRGAWNPRGDGPQPGYDAFVTFVAKRILSRHPEFSAVRVALERIVILPRGEGFRGTRRMVFTAERTRAEIFP
jgi:hypothetical protein